MSDGAFFCGMASGVSFLVGYWIRGWRDRMLARHEQEAPTRARRIEGRSSTGARDENGREI